jgi:hypothetical protein
VVTDSRIRQEQLELMVKNRVGMGQELHREVAVDV